MDEYIIHINRLEKTESLERIDAMITAMYDACVDGEKFDDEHAIAVLEAIRMAINSGEKVVVPIEMPPETMAAINAATVQVGDSLEMHGDMHLKIRTLQLKNGGLVAVAFTSHDEAMAGAGTSTITENLEHFMEKALMNPDIEGIMINPWGKSFFLSKANISTVFKVNLPAERENIVTFRTQDITQTEIECIVNAAKNSLLGGGGVDGAIHRAAGPELLEECRTLHVCATGEAKITKGYDLKADYVIHTVGPVYSGTDNDALLLRNCYWNSLELARKNDIHSIAFPAISTGVFGYPLEEATKVALTTVADWLKINPHYGMAILFACYNDKTTEIYNNTWDCIQENWNNRPIIRENNGILEQAMQYAMDCHKGAVRKGTTRPYILHPIETLQILSSMNADIHLMVAGLLHDTLEDTDATLLDIYSQFGVDVAALVNGHTEDKRKIWYMRKLHTISELPAASIRHKMLVLADKVANLRNMYADYKQVGEELWERFNAPKELQAWYYSKVIDGLDDLQDYPETESAYWEMVSLFKDLFVTFAVDDEKGLLYQLCADGDHRVLKKGKPQWKELEGNVSKDARVLSRKDAERMEDNWAEPFWAVHELDLSDATYEVFRSDNTFFFVEIKDGEILFRGDLIDDNQFDREIAYYMDNDNSRRFLVQLRLSHGTRNKLSTILRKEFSTEDGAKHFIKFCEEHSVEFQPLRV